MRKLSTYEEVRKAAKHIKDWPLMIKSRKRESEEEKQWILARNYWSDDGIWIDTETWND